jgi:hypothetical protein
VLHADEGVRYRGRLVSEPQVITELKVGEPVDFEERHILAIAYEDGELGYDHLARA